MEHAKAVFEQSTSQQSVSLQAAAVLPQVSDAAAAFLMLPAEHAKPDVLHSASQHVAVLQSASPAPHMIAACPARFVNPTKFPH